jgi:hypothetical protein
MSVTLRFLDNHSARCSTNLIGEIGYRLVAYSHVAAYFSPIGNSFC